MQTIAISVNGTDTMEVPAYLHGKFAVNLPPGSGPYIGGPKEAYCNITHVATGLRVMSVWGRAAARRIARRLDEAVKHDITADDWSQKSAQWRAFVAIVGPIVKGGEVAA